MSNIMIDIETLGRRNDAAIREVGMVVFNSAGVIEEQIQLSVDPAVWNTCGRTFSGETILWLLAHPHIDTNYNCHSYEELVTKVSNFILSHLSADGYVWSKGHMDLEVLKDLFEEVGQQLPWLYWQPRDLRTILDLTGDSRVSTTHCAVDDAHFQTILLKDTLESLKSK